MTNAIAKNGHDLEITRHAGRFLFVVPHGSLRPCEYYLAQLCHHTYMKTSQEILEIFIEKIKELMSEKNFNIKDFAEYVNIPRRTVNGWMANNKMPRIDYLYQIADCFGYSIDYLVGREI